MTLLIVIVLKCHATFFFTFNSRARRSCHQLKEDVFGFLCSFATAAAMLSGLLLYDVFWVFGSSHVFGDNVMVTVSDLCTPYIY